MGDYLLFNGDFHQDNEPLITANNRGLRYGDGLFETLRMSAGTIHFIDWHMQRMFTGLHLLHFELPEYFTPEYITRQADAICRKNKHLAARIRITIIRGNGTPYTPEDHFPHCIIQSWPLAANGLPLNDKGLVTGLYPDAKKAIDTFSTLKSNNYLPYLMAALHAKTNHWDDALLLNTAGRLCDASIANIFIVKNKIINTCPLQEGCVAGIMRRFLLENLPLHGFDTREQQLSTEDLVQADEVFLSNAIRGIQWVYSCEHATFGNQLVNAIHSKLFKEMV
ncbi:MAG: aminotransferase class IV [Bacteroidota bacterium]